MKLRLILMHTVADDNGVLAGKYYKTVIVDIPYELEGYNQIVGGEWLE